jgi:peptidyl-prolyl cis-trans isomerase D
MLSRFLKIRKGRVKKAKMAGTSLEAIAKAVGSTVQQATDVTMQNPVLTGGVGREPKVVGNAFALDANNYLLQLKEIQVCML